MFEYVMLNEYLPLKQGLRLWYLHGGDTGQSLNEYLPLKQGLRHKHYKLQAYHFPQTQ